MQIVIWKRMTLLDQMRRQKASASNFRRSVLAAWTSEDDSCSISCVALAVFRMLLLSCSSCFGVRLLSNGHVLGLPFLQRHHQSPDKATCKADSRNQISKTSLAQSIMHTVKLVQIGDGLSIIEIAFEHLCNLDCSIGSVCLFCFQTCKSFLAKFNTVTCIAFPSWISDSSFSLGMTDTSFSVISILLNWHFDFPVQSFSWLHWWTSLQSTGLSWTAKLIEKMKNANKESA